MRPTHDDWIMTAERTPKSAAELVLGFDGVIRRIVQWVGNLDADKPWAVSDVAAPRLGDKVLYLPAEAIPMWAYLPPHPLELMSAAISQIDATK